MLKLGAVETTDIWNLSTLCYRVTGTVAVSRRFKPLSTTATVMSARVGLPIPSHQPG